MLATPNSRDFVTESSEKRMAFGDGWLGGSHSFSVAITAKI